MKLSLVIPCYNEAKNLPLLLERCKAVAKRDAIEVILVDNGSTDGSSEILAALLVKYPGCRSIRVEVNQGYGYGILQGLRAATGDFIGWTHADMQTDPTDTLKALEILESSTGKAFVKGVRHGRPVGDVVFTMGMSVFETLLLRVRLWDINAQPTCFPRPFFESWISPPHDFSLDLYAYYMAKKSGLAIHRFPVLFGQRAHGVSHWNISWAAKWKFIQRTIGYSLKLVRDIK
jgi:glycosyltransferase involved in cell wall biosynthesis